MTKPPLPEQSFEALLDYLKRTRGFDFAGYKRTTLMRRVEKRMFAVGADDFAGYGDYLEVHPQEFDLLFNTILINVTAFFRDKEAWLFLNEHILPKMIEGSGPVRIWSAGCATGQEAYTIAMLLCEALGEHAFHERVKIYATDIDEEALIQARHATYDPRTLADVPENLRDRYFIRAGAMEMFRSDLRRMIIFGRHDLMQDAPIPRLDLLICRNTLMYLNADTQSRILARLHFALKPEGHLFLGRAEMLLSHTNLFEPIDLQHRVFGKVAKMNLRDRLQVLAQANSGDAAQQFAQYLRLKETSFETSIVAQIVIDANGDVSMVNNKAYELFGLTSSDIGKSFRDLEISYRPIDLRSIIDQVTKDRRPVNISKVSHPKGPDLTQFFEIHAMPLLGPEGILLGLCVSFDDVTRFYQLDEDLRAAHEELETTNEELQSTNEELETTNEELQSTNEELETTNEELQSTNEELETTNAELESTNEELEATNGELRNLTTEVEAANNFLQNILSGLRQGIIVVDRDFKVRIWNKRAEDLWGLRSDEVIGMDLFDLEIGLPMEALKARLNGGGQTRDVSETVLDSVNRRGTPFQCLVRASPLVGRKQEGGLVLLMDDRPIN